MANDITTLRLALTQRKAAVPRAPNTKSIRNYGSRRWPPLERSSIRLWEEFNLSNLNRSYGHVLDYATSEQSLLTLPLPEQALVGIVMNSDNDVRNLTTWNHDLMKETLEFSKKQLDLYSGISLLHRVSTNNSPHISLPFQDSGVTVDHVIALDDVTDPVLVVGLVKSSRKWGGRALVSELPNPTGDQRWPVRQLANLCETARTRYGYLQTDEEMVVCCFSRDEAQDSTTSDALKVAIMPIPWTKYGTEVLTSDLALWWLSMLAMSPKNCRTIVKDDEMVKIDQWEQMDLGDDQGWVRRHMFSNRDEPMSPPAENDRDATVNAGHQE